MEQDDPIVQDDCHDCLLGVFKFGALQHLEQFARGLIYMNTLGYFINQEVNSARKDSHEGTSVILRGDGKLLQVKVDAEYRSVANLWVRYDTDRMIF
jgi:hypothetical protein